ncbi:GNAT family N-acetyltransferase [Algibacter sp.]|uniref:GNAT family N-acetyltransferase n=1 Tax=Algibacter sp. TaxID=1872428 RepID=UPI003C779EAC
MFDGDNLETTIHLGIFIDTKIVGICSFFKNQNTNLQNVSQYQLRGMAVLKTHQGKNLGKIILKHGEQLLKEKNTKIIWCNAREVAVPFYEKTGYQITGNPFNISDIGLHYMMWKIL